MTSQTDARLVPDWSTGLTPEDLEHLLEQNPVSSKFSLERFRTYSHPGFYRTGYKLALGFFEKLETKLRETRTSWMSLRRLASEQSRQVPRASSDPDSEAIRVFQKGVRDAIAKADRAIEDVQLLEDSVKKIQYEIWKHRVR